LFTKPSIRLTYEVVYNLYELVPNLYLPEAFIVSRDKEGYLAHVKQKATPETIGSFDLELDATRARLFDIIEKLQPKVLAEKFTPARRKVKPLEELLEDKDIRKAVTQLVHRHLGQLLAAVKENQLPICWAVERRVLVKDFTMQIGETTLEPHLFFKKSDKGVFYQLHLEDEHGKWQIKDREVVPITNHPAWLFVDYKLYDVAHINGNMVKPFQNKDAVNIPQASVKTYFQNFILKVAGKADIDAEGFEIEQHGTLQQVILEPVKSLFSEDWVLHIRMDYGKTTFNWNDQRTKNTALNFQDGEDIRIYQIIRDKELEQSYLHKLKNFGLTLAEGTSYYHLSAAEDDPYALLHWIGQQRVQLEAEGFVLQSPVVENRSVMLGAPSLSFNTSVKNDWFDIYGEIVVGAFTIPFLKLVKYIQQQNRFYPLPDGTFFLIPLEWMNKYSTLAKFVKGDGDHMRLSKSQFTILEGLGIAEEEQPNLEEDFHFEPSDKLRATLRPYQRDGAAWLVQLYEHQLGACLADDMGLGKTLQTIAALLHAKEQRTSFDPEGQQQQQLDLFQQPDDIAFLKPLHALIVLPASLVFNWERELNRFAPHLSVYKHTGPKRQKDIRILQRFDVILTTYQTALRDVKILEQLEYEYIVLDESQQIKNKDSKVFKAINQLEARHKISLSGTPIENSLSDLWAQMQFINPNLLGNYNFFKKEFIRPIERQQDEVKKERLRSLVQPYLLRRTKEEVARDLPPLTTKIFYSEMSPEQKKLYEREKSATRNQLLEHFEAGNPKFKIQVLQSLTRLRQLVNHPKMVLDTYAKDSGKFQDILEHWDVIRKGGHKVLFFSSFVKYLTLFKNYFDEGALPYSWLSGALTPRQREQEIDKFDANPAVQSFLISIKSGGTGLNLTAADYVFILDPWWNPTIEQQAIARAHRIGQDQHVIAYKFITKDSIEEKILKLQERKTKLAEDILSKAGAGSFSKGELEFLLE
jgi:superfamily II DNA or RNA helicase